MKLVLALHIIFFGVYAHAQQTTPYVEMCNDTGDGFFQNPVLHADYSDPDAIRVGDDFFMISSSFNHVPGLPILHSKDLVNWTLIGHALKRLMPVDHFSSVQHGGGVWAPSLRFHENEFYIYYPDPDFGIYLIKSKNILGPWSEPILVAPGRGLIDPCPLWDDDGKVYLVHAFAGSRAGIKSVIIMKEMNSEGTAVINDGKIVFDGHETDPTVEGPKLYKRNGFYYIFAPAGGVSTGWQLALRSRNIYGPYERKVVMHQGKTSINGPHQGAWVDTKKGDNWFLHFQDKAEYGRVVHLQPMKWSDDWPVIGSDEDGDGTGEPVSRHKKPITISNTANTSDARVDDFNEMTPGLQWQWQANPGSTWGIMNEGSLRLYAQYLPGPKPSLWNYPAMLLQKFPAEEFLFTMKFKPKFLTGDEQFGLIVFGTDYAYISVSGKQKFRPGTVNFVVSKNAEKKEQRVADQSIEVKFEEEVFLQVKVVKGGNCSFAFSTDGENFIHKKESFSAKPGKWVGAKLGIFGIRNSLTNDAGFADVDWVKIEKLTGK